MPTSCLSVGLGNFPSVSQAPLLSCSQSPALSLSCLPSGLFSLFTNLAGLLLWEQRRCSVLGRAWLQLAAPIPFLSPGAMPPPPTSSISGRPLGSERPPPTVPRRGEAELLGWHPLFLTLWPPFLSPTRSLKLHLSRLEAAPLPIV